MRLSAAKLMAAALWAFLLFPAAGSEAPRWLKIKSPNFEIFTTGSERNGREIARHFEQVRSFFLDSLHWGLRSGPAVRIVVFRNEKEFRPYAPNQIAATFYMGAEDRDYIVMRGGATEDFPVAVHEYTHLLVKHSGHEVPVWFNEGLAELFSNLTPRAGKIQVGAVLESHFVLLRQSRWIDLPTLLAVSHDSSLYNEQSRAGMFYAESWALMHMLYLGHGYRPNFPALTTAIKNDANVTDALQKANGKDVSQIEKDLRAYMLSNSFNTFLFDTKLSKEVDTLEVANCSSWDAELVLAEIMANNVDQAAAAHDLFSRLARENPKDWQTENGLGRLCWREHNTKDALVHFARAADLGSTDARMYLLYGQLLLNSSKRAEALRMMKRATELDPANREAALNLASLYLMEDQYKEALAQLTAIKQVTPDQAFGYFHSLAYAHYRLDQEAEARIAVANCRKYAKTPEQIATLAQLSQALDWEPAPESASAEATARAKQLQVRENPADKPADSPLLPVVEGTLQQLDCMGRKIRVHVQAEGKSLAFAIIDPGSVVLNHSGPSAEFICGPQAHQRVRIAYDPTPGQMPGTMGVVRTMDFE